MLRENQTDPIRLYEGVCLAALAGLFLLLLERGLGQLVLLPLLIGLGGVLGRGRLVGQTLTLWRAAPYVLVGCLAFLVGPLGAYLRVLAEFRPSLEETTMTSDALLAAAVLAYVAGHFRLQGLEQTPLPGDPRRDGPPQPSRRPAPATEVAALGVSVLVWAALAALAWDALPADWYDLEIDPVLWRFVILIWLVGVGGLLAASLLAYASWQRLSRPEAELMLQDIFWRETRREQRRVARWLAWSEVRRARKEQR
jgi:hypothetical protein